MAKASGNKTSSSAKNTVKSPAKSTAKSISAGGTGKRSSKTGGSLNIRKSGKRKADAAQAAKDRELFHEIGLIVLLLVMILLFLCNFGLIGPLGNAVRDVMFGLFGWTAYAVPVVLFVGVAFWFANEGNPTALRKILAGAVLLIMAGVVSWNRDRNGRQVDFSHLWRLPFWDFVTGEPDPDAADQRLHEPLFTIRNITQTQWTKPWPISATRLARGSFNQTIRRCPKEDGAVSGNPGARRQAMSSRRRQLVFPTSSPHAASFEPRVVLRMALIKVTMPQTTSATTANTSTTTISPSNRASSPKTSSLFGNMISIMATTLPSVEANR